MVAVQELGDLVRQLVDVVDDELDLVLRQRAADLGELQREQRSEEHTSELQSPCNLVCRLLLEKKNRHEAAAQEFVDHPAVFRLHDFDHGLEESIEKIDNRFWISPSRTRSDSTNIANNQGDNLI